MSDHVAVVGTGAFVGEAAGRGGLCCVVGMPSFPAAPNFVDDRARAEWERAFAGNVERYYSLCDRVVSTWGACRVDGKFVFGTGAGVAGCLSETDSGSGLATVGGFGRRTDSCVCQAKLGCAERGAAGGVAGSDGGGVVEVGTELESCRVEAAVVGKQHGKNVRKRARAKAKRLVAVGSKEGLVGLGEHVPDSSKVVGGVGYAGAFSSGSEVESGDAVSSVVGAVSEVVSYRDVTSKDERALFARQWFERKRVENELAIQRAKYNVKRNAYLDRARISEKKWEQERLSCEQKLAKITEIRFGSKPGYAETLASLSDGSEKPPSLSTGSDSPAVLSDGTISPDSSMSVAEVKKMERRFEEKLQDLSERLAKVTLENEVFRASTKFTGGRAVLENGRVEVYDGSGQYVPPTPVYGSECELYSMGDYPEELQYS